MDRGDVHYFLSDGFLTFSKPVAGAPIAAVFTTDVEGGDAEVILLPPTKEERRVLNRYIDSPNIDEHLHEAAFFFADDTFAELKKQMAANEWIHPDPLQGGIDARKFTPILRHLVPQFATYLTLDLLNTPHLRGALFAALLNGKTLSGNTIGATSGPKHSGPFTVVFDTHSSEQLLAGESEAAGFQTWASYTPKSLRNHPSPPEFHVDHYHIDARIDSKLRMFVETTFTVSELDRDLHALAFDLSQQMKITSAEIDGHPAEVEENNQPFDPSEDSSDRMFLLTSGALLPAGSTHVVKLTHQGDVITTGAGNVFFVGSRGRWYPHRSLQFSRFDLTFHFPKTLDLVAGGEQVSDTTTGEERTIVRRSDVPLPMAGFNLGNYRRTLVKRGDFTIEICANRDGRNESVFNDDLSLARPTTRPRGTPVPFAAPDPPDRFSEIGAEIADIMDFYSRRFGPPPLRRLVVSPIPGKFGQGFGGIIYLSTMAYMNPSGHTFAEMDPETRLFFSQLMLAHEAAHQWWGNLVITAGYHDEWITEALANYCAMQYLEKRTGHKAVSTLMNAYRDSLLQTNKQGLTVESAGPLTQGRRIELESEPAAWISIMYGKGAWVMSMLAARMGDENFLKMLAALRTRYEQKGISTAQFQELCAEFMPKSEPDPKLDEFFDQWVSGTGIPQLKLASSLKGGAPSLRIAGTLTQTDVPDDFSAWFPIEVQLHGKKLVKWIESSSDPVSFTLPVPSAPIHVTLDPEGRFLKR